MRRLDLSCRPRRRSGPSRFLTPLSVLLCAAAPAVAQTARDSARAAYDRGMAELARGDARIPSPGNILHGVTLWQDFLAAIGQDRVAKARREFRAAVSFDPDFLEPAVQLGQLSLATRDPQELTEAANALGILDRMSSPPAEAVRVGAEVALARLDTARASRLAATYAATPGRDPSIARLEQARAAFLVGDAEEATALYLAGLDSLTAVGSDAYLADLGPLVEEARAMAWDNMWVGARAQWLRREWSGLAATAERTQPEVMGEHYRRLRIALDRFARTSRRAVTAFNPDVVPHGIAPGLDDRGIIFVRHGAPLQVVAAPVSDCVPHEAWQYGEGASRRVLHFVALNRATEFVLVANPLVGCQTPAGMVRELEALAALDGRYNSIAAQAHLAGAGGGAPLQQVNDALRQIVNENRDAAEQSLETTDYKPHPESAIRFYYDTYAFRGDSGRVEIVAALAVPGDALSAQRDDEGVHYQLRASLVALSAGGEKSYRADTTIAFSMPRKLRPNENVVFSLQLAVPQGTGYRHEIAVELPGGKAAGYYGGPLPLPTFGPDTLSTSDIVMAEAHGHGWKRGPQLGLIPPRQYPRSTISTYYELYNLPDDSTFYTTVRVTELGGRGLLRWIASLFGHGADISRSYVDVAHSGPNGTISVLRPLDLAHLAPGAYRLEVTTHALGRTVRRRTDFVVQNARP